MSQRLCPTCREEMYVEHGRWVCDCNDDPV